MRIDEIKARYPAFRAVDDLPASRYGQRLRPIRVLPLVIDHYQEAAVGIVEQADHLYPILSGQSGPLRPLGWPYDRMRDLAQPLPNC